jgi:hypothetical protein
MNDQIIKIGSGKALAIIREVRPHANQSSLKAFVDRGLIRVVEKVSARKFVYDANQVREVAKQLAEIDSL